MKKINIILNTKGGVGKSTISIILCQLLAYRNIDFKYIEIDNSNDTTKALERSETFKNKMISIMTDKADEELYAATFEALKEDKVIIVDIGGGTDTREIIDLINEQFTHMNSEINFILPFENSYKQMPNLLNTYNLIDNPENTYFVKNKVIPFKDKKDEYIFFEGSKIKGVENYRKKINPINKVFEVNLSDLHGIAEISKETILDVAALAMQYSKDEAHKMFISEYEMAEYVSMMTRFTNSENCLKDIQQLNEEFEELFNE